MKDVEGSLAALKEDQEGSVTCRIIASEQGKKKILMSVDAALSLGCFIKSLMTFELDGGEEVRLGVLSDVQSLPSIHTDMALCIFNFLSRASIMA